MDDQPITGNKHYNKLMEEVKKNPRLRELITHFQNNPSDAINNQTSLRHKTRALLREKRLQRSSQHIQQTACEKQAMMAQVQKEKDKEEKASKKLEDREKKTNTVKQTMHDQVSATLAAQKRKK